MNKERIKKLERVCLELSRSYIFEQTKEETDFWIITIINVKISSDLSYIDIFISSLKKKDLLTKKLALLAKDIQRLLWKKLEIRKIPKVRFRYDDKWEVWQEITDLINEITIENSEKLFKN